MGAARALLILCVTVSVGGKCLRDARGAAGPPEDPAIRFDSYPVVFVHGLSGAAEDTWSDMRDWLEDSQRDIRREHLAFAYTLSDRYGSFTVTGDEIGPGSRRGTFINEAMDQYLGWRNGPGSRPSAGRPPKVILVSQSYGGLNVRWYVQGSTFAHDVEKAVFVGASHTGSPYGAFGDWENLLFYEGPVLTTGYVWAAVDSGLLLPPWLGVPLAALNYIGAAIVSTYTTSAQLW